MAITALPSGFSPHLNKLLSGLFKTLHNVVFRSLNTLFGHAKKACFKRTIKTRKTLYNSLLHSGLIGVYLFINLKQLIMKGTLRLFLVLCITALSMTLVQAQERTYSGVVKGSDGQPIIGASVEVVGTTVGTSTGLDGDYTIKAKQGSKIKFSFLGTKSVTVTAGGSSTVNVTLEDDAMGLEEVVVQAFGTAKKKDLTGSVSSIDSKLISSQSNSTLSKALEGSIPRYRYCQPEQCQCVDRNRWGAQYKLQCTGNPEPEGCGIDHRSEGCRFDSPVGFARRQRRRDGNDQARPAGQSPGYFRR